MDDDSSQGTSRALESVPQRATLVKPLRPGQHLIAACLLNAPTSQMTAEEIHKWLAEKYPYYRYTKRQTWDFLRRGSKGDGAIFMIANQYRIKGDLNRWAIRPEIEPQLRRCWSGPPLPQPPFLQSSGGQPKLVPGVLEAALVGRDPPADQSSSKRQHISYQEASTPTQWPLSTSTKGPLWHKQEAGEAKEEHNLECLQSPIPRETQERVVLPMSCMQRNTIIEDHHNAMTSEDATHQRQLRDYSNRISTFDSKRGHMLYTKAAVVSIVGRVELRVKVDGSSRLW
ncbi:hypothetical protein B0J14DRAFT_601506 [Halenospora varia]|nr:hypothetical protein B0J14DRAFT_601506 [Halenospora varia]